MEAFLKSVYKEVLKLITELWAYRLKILVYLIFIIITAHAINPYHVFLEDINFFPEQYKFLISLLFSLFSGIAIAELVIKVGNIFYKRFYLWKSLTEEENIFVSYYIRNNTKTQYVTAYNGACVSSGTINLLLKKRIIYLASQMSEYRDNKQQFPFNIYNDAFYFFKRHKPIPEILPDKI